MKINIKVFLRSFEEVASVANLAQALLKVIRNKGAPGVDGQTVEEAQHNAALLLSALRHALLTECYRPGDVRRGRTRTRTLDPLIKSQLQGNVTPKKPRHGRFRADSWCGRGSEFS